jgi:single-strand DNA-binding protein
MGTNFNFNKAIIGGRLTSDPELKKTQAGTSVTSFTIAVSRKKNKDGDQQSDFINCVAFRERAEFICRYFAKGNSICVVGEVQTRKWQDNNGNTRYATEIIVNEVSFVDSKGDGQAPATAPSNPPSYMPDAYKTPQFEEMAKDDDLPF